MEEIVKKIFIECMNLTRESMHENLGADDLTTLWQQKEKIISALFEYERLFNKLTNKGV